MVLLKMRPNLSSLKLWLTAVVSIEVVTTTSIGAQISRPTTALDPLWYLVNAMPQLEVLHLDVQLYERIYIHRPGDALHRVLYRNASQVTIEGLKRALFARHKEFHLTTNAAYLPVSKFRATSLELDQAISETGLRMTPDMYRKQARYIRLLVKFGVRDVTMALEPLKTPLL